MVTALVRCWCALMRSGARMFGTNIVSLSTHQITVLPPAWAHQSYQQGSHELIPEGIPDVVMTNYGSRIRSHWESNIISNIISSLKLSPFTESQRTFRRLEILQMMSTEASLPRQQEYVKWIHYAHQVTTAHALRQKHSNVTKWHESRATSHRLEASSHP